MRIKAPSFFTALPTQVAHQGPKEVAAVRDFPNLRPVRGVVLLAS